MSTIISQPNPVGIRELSAGTHARPTQLDMSGGTHLEASPPYSRSDQARKIIEIIRNRHVKIAVIINGMDSKDPTGDKALATSIATELNRMLSGSKALVYEYTIVNKDWFDYLRSVQVTYYIFIDLPPYTPYHNSTPESEFFNPRSQKITEAVVVRRRPAATTPGGTPRTTAFTPVHYLEKFVHLEGNPSVVSEMALSHFGGEYYSILTASDC